MAYSLSFFDTELDARNRHKELQASHPLISKTIGTHLGSVDLDESHGLIGEINQVGHFSLYEATGCVITYCLIGELENA